MDASNLRVMPGKLRMRPESRTSIVSRPLMLADNTSAMFDATAFSEKQR